MSESRGFLLNRIIFVVVLAFIAFALYTCSLVFDEDARLRRGSIFTYLLIPAEVRHLPVPDAHWDLRYHSFPGDGPAQPFTEVEFTVASGDVGSVLQTYKMYLTGKGCTFVGERHEAGSKLAEWQCSRGLYRFVSSRDYRRGQDGRNTASGRSNVNVEFHEDFSQ